MFRIYRSHCSLSGGGHSFAAMRHKRVANTSVGSRACYDENIRIPRRSLGVSS